MKKKAAEIKEEMPSDKDIALWAKQDSIGETNEDERGKIIGAKWMRDQALSQFQSKDYGKDKLIMFLKIQNLQKEIEHSNKAVEWWSEDAIELNGKIKELQSEIEDLKGQLQLSEAKVKLNHATNLDLLEQLKPDNKEKLNYETLITIAEATSFMQGYKGTCVNGEWSEWDESVLKKLTELVINEGELALVKSSNLTDGAIKSFAEESLAYKENTHSAVLQRAIELGYIEGFKKSQELNKRK